MENTELLFQKNFSGMLPKKLKISHGIVVYENKREEFSGVCIRQLLCFLNGVMEKYKKRHCPIIILLGNVQFKDKLTYIFLEIIWYAMIEKYHNKLNIQFRCERSIHTEGIKYSPLVIGDLKNTQKCMAKFRDDIYKTHFRKILAYNDGDETLSKTMGDITYYLGYCGIEQSCADDISEVVSELIGNAWEHANTSCLVDIDVTGLYGKEGSNESYAGINIAVVNFSESLFGDALKQRILQNEEMLDSRYKKVKEAYTNHKNFFDDEYTETDFFNIASFQHKISGSINKSITGGTGLTKLIGSLEKRSDTHNCYMISGTRALWFNHKFLEYNDGWIGFNEQNDFFSNPPSKKVIGKSAIYMPGTAFNLNFVMKQEV